MSAQVKEKLRHCLSTFGVNVFMLFQDGRAEFISNVTNEINCPV
jgi:hypothetical protein